MGKSGKYSNLFNVKKDGANKEARSFFRYAVVSGGIFIIVVAFLIHDSAFRWIKSGCVARQQEKQMVIMEEEISAMDREMEYLTNDRDSLEKFAREKFGFCAEGEDVYIDSEGSAASSSAH